MTLSFDQQAHAEPAPIAVPHEQRPPSGLREESTAHFGAHFDDIDISPTAVAPAMTANGAGALTVGDAIAFGDTTYQPDSGWGRELIAHELAHVVQQRGRTGRPSDPGRLALELATAGFRPKLKVDQPGDVYEQEADEIADRVMRSPAGDASGSRGGECCSGCASGTGCSGGVQRQAASAGSRAHGSEVSSDTESRIRSRGSAGQLNLRKPSDAAERAADAAGQHPLVHPTTRTVDAIDASAPARTSASLTSAALFHEAVASPGEPLDEDTRAFMEPRFHHNFSNVRVHADMSSSRSAGRVNALAYTAGRDIVFAAGSYAPGTDSGRRLLAHELAHVVQQSSGPVDGALVTGGIKLSDPADRFEQEAELTAERVIAGRLATTRPGGNAPTSQSAGPALSVQRSNGSTPLPAPAPPVPRPASRAAYQALLQSLREAMAKPTTTNPELGKIIEKLYRDNPEVGSGSTAAALRQELATGMPTKDTYHLTKAMDQMNKLAGWLKANPSASRADRLLAENLFLDLQEAVHSGYYADIRYEPIAPDSATPTGGPAGSPSGGHSPTPSGGGTVAELEKDLTDAVRTEEAVEGLGIGTAAAVTVGEGVINTLIANLAMQAALEIILVVILPGQNEVYVEPKLVQEAFVPAIPKILAQLALRGVGEHPSGEFAQLLERTKGGQSIYANALVGILPPVLRTGIPVTGQEVYEKKTEVGVLWVSLSTTSSATKEPLRLTIDGGEREGPLRVLSFRVYNPDAIATELLVKKPEVV